MPGDEDAKTFCFDLDGTLCTNTWGEYERAQPYPWAIERVNALAEAGHRILIFTARGTTTGIDWREQTEAQLRSWGIRYDELLLGKPQADVYVDDRTVHVDAWRYGDAVAMPRPGTDTDERSMPVLPPPRTTTLVETGRTFAGSAFRVERHARRLAATADAYGIPRLLSEQQIAGAVREVVESAAELLPGGDEIVFTVALGGPPASAYLDTIEHWPDANLTIGCRLLSQAAAGLPRYFREGGVVASTDPAQSSLGSWPLRSDPEGRLRDMFGGELVAVRDGQLLARSGAHLPVALAHVLELAAGLGLAARPELAPTADADELLIVDLPFCVLPVAKLDRRQFPGVTGPVALALRRAWRDSTGSELAASWPE